MLYKNSEKVCKRDTHILYYDCTNFFFETTCEDEPDNLRQYGVSKEHRPNPIVGMGLFMDAKGIPLAFDIYPGNKNEQLTMCPIEERIKKDFGKSEFIAVTDAGLSSRANKRFNSEGGRAYITTQSLKKLSKDLQEWALAKDGWRLARSKKTYTIDEIEDDFVKNYNRIFYKERMIKADGKDALEEKLIVTFSLKYREYCANIRDKQVRRAEKKLERGISTVNRKSQNDPARFIECRSITGDGEVATNTVAHINEDKVAKEAVFDGFYAVSTSLVDEGSVSEILKINKNRWEIEECFRIMKTEFEARPVYLSRQERIKAHFLVCFIALLVYRILEQKLGYKYTCDQILNALKSMQLAEFKGFGYACIYNPTEITDAMHEVCGFRTDTEGLTYRDMKNIIARSKWEKVIDTESK
jgi:transposase